MEKESRHQEPDLFPQEHEIYNQRTEKINQSQGIEFKHTSNQSQGSDNKPIEIEKRNDRKSPNNYLLQR